MSHRIRTRLAIAVALLAVIALPPSAEAGGVVTMIDSAFTAGGGGGGGTWEPTWDLGNATALDNGPAQGKIQEHLYGEIVAFEATLPDQTVVDVSAIKIQMSATSDVVVVRNGDHLEWYLGVTQLSCDSTRSTSGVPTEFFATLVGGSSIKVIDEANPGTFVVADSITIDLDTDTIDCP